MDDAGPPMTVVEEKGTEDQSYGWVLRTSAGQVVGRIRLKKTLQEWEVSMDKPVSEIIAVDAIRQAISPLSKESAVHDQVAHALEDLARQHGHALSPLPDGPDVEVSVSLTMDSDGPLSKVTALHDAANWAAASGVASAARVAVQGAMQRVVEEILLEVDALLTAGKFADAARRAHSVFSLDRAAVRKVREHLLRIDRSTLSVDDRGAVLDTLVAAAGILKKFADAIPETDELIALTTEPVKLRNLRLMRANAEGALQRVETARVLYQELLADPDAEVDVRAWAFRGLAMASPPRSEQQRIWEERAGDAFAESGDRTQMATSYLSVARRLRHREPVRALALVERVVESFSEEDPRTIEERASILHMKAELHHSGGKLGEAFAAAHDAAELRSKIQGNEPALSSSLHLAAGLADALGDRAASAELLTRAEILDRTLRAEDAIRVRVFGAMQANDLVALKAGRDEAEAVSAQHIVALADIYIALHDQSLSHAGRIASIEGAQRRFGRRARDGDLAIVASAFAEAYRASGDYDSALAWYLRVLELSPEDQVAWRNAVALLFKAQRWQDAIDVLRVELELRGERPGLMTALGQALIEVGEPQEAVRALVRAKKLAKPDQHVHIDSLMERAATTPVTKTVQVVVPRFASLYDLEMQLLDFKAQVEGEWRMQFWRRVPESKKHKWKEEPEAHAKALLQAFLSGGALKGSEILEEVRAGWGRIDLYVRLAGGERVVIELKMLGAGYSSTYAAEGFDQLCHYMASKQTNVGYLIAFDARLRDQGKVLRRAPEAKDRQIAVLMVDMRPSPEDDDDPVPSPP